MSLLPKPKLCPYCGTIVKELTKDHIIPRRVFVQSYSDTVATVRVCSPCNQEKGLNEDDLRDFLILNRDEQRSAEICKELRMRDYEVENE